MDFVIIVFSDVLADVQIASTYAGLMTKTLKIFTHKLLVNDEVLPYSSSFIYIFA